jgi:hypothetical protein
MRYWIYWNDLIQGPFELEELSALKALSEELPVCLEDRTDWIPACRIADLAPIIEQMRSARMPPPLPPPPPSGHPMRSVLQGELFTDPPEQETLFPESETPKGPFALSEQEAQMRADLYSNVRLTAPFRFESIHVLSHPEPIMLYSAPAVNRMPSPLTKQSAVPDIQDAAPELSTRTHIPLEIYPDIPEVSSTAEPALTGLPSLDLEPSSNSNIRLVAWIAGILIGCMLLGSIGFKLFDLSTSRSAIEEVRRHPTVNAPIVAPVIPAPSLKVSAAGNPVTHFFHWLKSKVSQAPQTAAAKPAPVTPLAAPIAASPVLTPRNNDVSYAAHPIKKSAHAAHADKKLRKAAKRAKVVPVLMPKVPPIASVPVATSAPTEPTSNAAAAPRDKSSSKKSMFKKIGGLFKPRAAAVVPAASIPTPASAPITFTPLATPPSTAAGHAPMSGLPEASAPGTPDPWLGRHNEAITLVMNRKIGATPQTIATRSRIMLEEMHDKELLHAADTGLRLYLPDKIAWNALRESGPMYRVYLNFSALQANGERVQSLSYQFEAELARRVVTSDDPGTQTDFMKPVTALEHKREARASDIENILSAVDHFNKQRMRAVIVKKSRKNRVEDKKIEEAIKTAHERMIRAIVYFRTKYPEVMLQNVAHAYDFEDLLKNHV